MTLLRIKHGAAVLCYGVAWLSMFALIAMLTVAEVLRGEGDAEAGANGDSADADSVAHLHLVRRTRR
jgi:hypothetical protein